MYCAQMFAVKVLSVSLSASLSLSLSVHRFLQPTAAVIQEFMTMMAICHTAVPERAEGKITYQAASPGTSHTLTCQQRRSRTVCMVFITACQDIFTVALIEFMPINNNKSSIFAFCSLKLSGQKTRLHPTNGVSDAVRMSSGFLWCTLVRCS